MGVCLKEGLDSKVTGQTVNRPPSEKVDKLAYAKSAECTEAARLRRWYVARTEPRAREDTAIPVA